MARVWITIDRVDGSTTVRGPYYPDEINTMGLLMRLNESDLATVTFTNADPLGALLRQRAKENDGNRTD